MRINAGVINAPNKSYLLDPPKQAAALNALFNINKVDFAAMPEMYTGLLHEMNKRGKVVMPVANNVLSGGYSIGTGLYVNTDRWRVLDVWNLKLDWDVRGPRGLNFPVALVQDKKSGVKVVFIAAHLPTLNSSSVKVRTRMNAKIKNYARQFDVPVIIAGDFNDGDVRDQYTGFRLAAGESVDHVLARGLKINRRKVIRKGIKGKITDHEAMVIGRMSYVSQDRVPLTKRLIGLIRSARRRQRNKK